MIVEDAVPILFPLRRPYINKSTVMGADIYPVIKSLQSSRMYNSITLIDDISQKIEMHPHPVRLRADVLQHRAPALFITQTFSTLYCSWMILSYHILNTCKKPLNIRLH